VERIQLAKNRVQWPVLVNKVMNSLLHKMRGTSCTAEKLLAYDQRM
jgi:hypothetical protein